MIFIHISLNHSISLLKRKASNPSQVENFSIDSIMNHNEETNIEPINTTLSKFGVKYENQFVVLEDAKHVIGVDQKDGNNLIIENVETGKADTFQCGDPFSYFNETLLYDENTGSLCSGINYGGLYKYKVNIASKSCERVKDYGNPKIGCLYSSYRFMNFVFFGGYERKIRVLDLSTGDLLPGHLKTAIWYIYSLQVCVNNNDKIYLTVSGGITDYSDYETDLLDLTDLIQVDSVILHKYL